MGFNIKFFRDMGIDIASILDTHCGLVSLCLSAIKFNSSFNGCDMHTPYFEAAIKRIQNHTAQQTIFDCGA